MNILMMMGQLLPLPKNNANLLAKLIPFLQENHIVHILAPAFDNSIEDLPKNIFGVPVHWAKDTRSDFERKLLHPIKAKLLDRDGYSDLIYAEIIKDSLNRVKSVYPYDAVISTSEPVPNAVAASCLDSSIKKVLYIMDPLNSLVDDGTQDTAYRTRIAHEMYNRQNVVITTPFICEALKNNGEEALSERIAEVGFPHVSKNMLQPSADDIVMDSSKINLLFCGALFESVRSPEFFLKVLSRLDERFAVYFMGRNCVDFWKDNAVETSAEVYAFPPQKYEVALNAMANADIMINIGNNMHVHMPSKTLEYINTSKPIVNFYKFEDCPTLYYTNRYPLCLNVDESKADIEETTKQFAEFCLLNKGKLVSRAYIEETYRDCTPEYIARKILDELEK